MNCRELYEQLQPLITPGGELTVTGGHGGDAFWPMLRALRRDDLTISRVELDLADEQLVISGRYPCFGSEAEMTILCRSEDDVIIYTVTLSLPGERTLEALFGELSKSLVHENNLPYYAPSVLAGTTIHDITFVMEKQDAILAYPFKVATRVSVPGTPPWGLYSWLIPGTMDCAGWFAFGDDFRAGIKNLFVLDAEAGSVDLPLGRSRVRLRLYNGESNPTSAVNNYLSGAAVILTIELEGLSEPVNLVAELFQSNSLWLLNMMFEKGLSVADIAVFFSKAFGAGGGHDGLLLPEDTPLSEFKLYDMGFTYDFTSSKFLNMRLLFGLNKPWILPVSFIRLEKLRLVWQISNGTAESGVNDYLLTADADAEAVVSIGGYDLTLDISANLPTLDFEGSLEIQEGGAPSAGDMLGQFAVRPPGEWNTLKMAHMDFKVSQSQRSLYIGAYLDSEIKLSAGALTLTLKELFATASVSTAQKAFNVGGIVRFGGEEGFSVLLYAAYNNGRWVYTGRLHQSSVSINKLLRFIMGLEISGFDIELTEFELGYEEAGLSVSAAFLTDFSFLIPGVETKAGGRISLERGGKLSAMFNAAIGPFTALAQVNDFYTANPQYILRVAFADKFIQGTYSEKTEVYTFTLGGITLKDAAEGVINIFNPYHKISLSAPWDILHKIELSRLNFIIDSKNKKASFTYNANLDIAPMIHVGSVGVTYDYGAGGGVSYFLTGTVMDKSYDEKNPMVWDAVNGEPPAAVPQKGGKFKLNYLAMAQHMRADEVKNAAKLKDAIDGIKKMAEPGYAHVYDADTYWLFGMQFTVNNMLTLSLVLNDPNLYGLLITVNGASSGGLAFLNGLALELFYQKITDNTGKFEAALQIPLRYRKFDLGAMKFTLGELRAAIYTNGSFLVDLGFPHNNSFARSFSVEMGQFVGRGGFYFGVMTGDAATQTPVPATGFFSPVVLIGAGISVGIGKSFDFGVVTGSFSIELYAIFEGVFAIWNESEKEDARREFYFKVDAVAGITGKLSLTVDFYIVKVRASAVIDAHATLALESYRKSNVELSLSLEVSASITIIFVTVSFSFDFRHSFSFAIGSDSPAPWNSNALPAHAVAAPRRFTTFLGRRWDIKYTLFPIFSGVGQGVSAGYCAAFVGMLDQDNACKTVEMVLEWILSEWEQDFLTSHDVFLPGDDGNYIEQEPKEINYAELDEFLSANAVLSVGVVWEKEADAAPGPEKRYIMPMVPELTITYSNPVPRKVDFSAANPVGDDYIRELREYFKKLYDSLDDEDSLAALNSGTPLAKVVFLDCFSTLRGEAARRVNKLFREITVDTPTDINLLCEEYAADLTRLLNDNVHLTCALPITFPVLPVTLPPGAVLASLRSYQSDWSALFASIRGETTLLRQGANYYCTGVTIRNTLGLSLETVAAVMFVRIYGDLINVPAEHFEQEIIKENENLDTLWEGRALGERVINLPGMRGYSPWVSLIGDSVARLAKLTVLFNLDTIPQSESVKIEWEGFKQAVVRMNPRPGVEINMPGFDLKINGDTGLGALYARISPTVAAEDIGWEKNYVSLIDVLNPFSIVKIKNAVFNNQSGTGSLSISRILEKTGCGVERLAEAVKNQPACLTPGQRIRIVTPGRIPKDEIRRQISTPDSADAICSMLSRFLLQGLQILDPQAIREVVPMYAFLGQQFPVDTDEDVSLTVAAANESCPWLCIEDDKSSGAITKDMLEKWLPKGSVSPIDAISIDKSFAYTKPCWPVYETLPVIMQAEQRQTASKSIHRLPKGIETLEVPPELFNRDMERITGSFCLMFPFDISRTESSSVFRIMGIAVEYRLLLYEILQAAPELSLHLLAQSNAAQNTPDGFLELDLDQTASYLLKTNLSLETKFETAADSAGAYYALLENQHAFLKILWECSVVCGGYNLRLENKSGAMPTDYLFDDNGNGKLWILINFRTDDGMLFSNTYLTDDTSQYEQAPCFYGQEATVPVPVFPPGYAGFTITQNIPELPESVDRLYHVFGYRVLGNENYERSNLSIPALPLEKGRQWSVPVTVPLYRFVLGGEGNPYSLLGKEAAISFNRRDILGNDSDAAFTVKLTPAYNDNLIPVGQWGVHSLFYEIKEDALGEPLLTVICSPLELSEREKQDPGPKLAHFEKAALQLHCEHVIVYLRWLDTQVFHFDDAANAALKEYTVRWRDYLRDPSGQMPEELRLDFSLKNNLLYLPEDAPFELNLELVVERLMYVPKDAPESFAIAKTSLLPIPGEQGDASFAAAMEKALPSLKLAYCGQKLYGVTFGPNGFIKGVKLSPYDISGYGVAPLYLTLRPFMNSPVSRAVTIDGKERLFANIDMDVWVKNFLTDFEAFLNPDRICRLADKDKALAERLIDDKKNLADAVTDALMPLYRDAGNIPASTARAQLSDRLRQSLTEGYVTDVTAVYKLEMTAASVCRLTAHAASRDSKSTSKISASKLCSHQPGGEDNTFLLFIQNNSTSALIKQNYDILIPELEFDIKPHASGYESSSWLKFITPVTGGALLDVDLSSQIPVPNPLKLCPVPPAIPSQQREQSYGTAPTADEILRWNYQADIRYHFFEQDTVRVDIVLAGDGAKRAGNGDLFELLAKYSVVRDRLLTELVDGSTDCFGEFEAFTAEAPRLVRSWLQNKSHESRAARFDNAAMMFSCEISFRRDEDGKLSESVKLLGDSAQTLEKLGAEYKLIFDKTAADKQDVDFSLKLVKLPIYTCNYAEVAAHIIRNHEILYNEKTQTWLPVHPCFIYTTDSVDLPALRGFCAYYDEYELPISRQGQDSLFDAIETVWKSFIKDGVQLTLCIWYGYDLPNTAENACVKIPVILVPLNKANHALLENIKENVRLWHNENQPSSQNAFLVFDLNVYDGEYNIVSLPQIRVFL